MKYLVLLAVILVVFWYLRGNRRGAQHPGSASGRSAAATTQDMVRCPVCSVHLPRADALPGPGGQMYCCDEHRARAAGHG